MYNPIEVSQAASKAREELEKSGQVGRTEATKSVVIPDGNIDLTAGFAVANVFVGTLHAGASYIVKWDGRQYTCKATTQTGDGLTAIVLGNLRPMGGPDTGEPFSIFDNGSEFVMVDIELWSAAEGSVVSRTVGLTAITETIHPIDPKFLPGVCLPVVEITSTVYPFGAGNTVSLTAEESAQFNAAVGASDFVLIKIRFDADVDLYDAFVVCCLHVDGVTVLSHMLTTERRLVFFGPDPETGLWAMGG